MAITDKNSISKVYLVKLNQWNLSNTEKLKPIELFNEKLPHKSIEIRGGISDTTLQAEIKSWTGYNDLFPLLDALNTFPLFNFLTLKTCSISPASSGILKQLVDTNLVVLELTGCIKTDYMIDLYVSILSSETSKVKSLFLKLNKLSDADINRLSEPLASNKKLIALSLWGNNIGDSGASFLAEALKKNTTLQYLNLGNNKIRRIGAQCIAESLSKWLISTEVFNEKKRAFELRKEDSKLKQLDGTRPGTSMSKKSLDNISVPDNKSKKPPPKISKVVEKNLPKKEEQVKTMQSVGKKGLQETKKNRVKELDEIDTYIEIDGQYYICGNRSLTELNLSGNLIDLEGAQYLKQALLDQDKYAALNEELSGLCRLLIDLNPFVDNRQIYEEISSLLAIRNHSLQQSK